MDEAGTVREMPDMARMKKELWAISINDDDTRQTIQHAWQQHHLLLEPHGAVGWLGSGTVSRKASVFLDRDFCGDGASGRSSRRRLSGCWAFRRRSRGLAEVERKQEQYRTMPVDYAAFHKLILERYGS